MEDVTDTVFRQIIAKCAPPDIYFTEFVNVDGLQSPGREHLIHRLKFSAKEKPIIAQIWGKDPGNFYKTAKELVEMGFDGVDLNMGCPVKAVVNNGCCSALINDRSLAKEIIDSTKEGVAGKIPVSVKTRLGFNEIDLTWHEFLLNQSLDALTIHGRTKKEMSKVPANWEAIGDVRAIRDSISPKTKIIGNGDVATRKEGEELAKKYKLDGIMIGRGVFADPFVFSKDSIWLSYGPEQKKMLFKEHVELFTDIWKNNEASFLLLKKFAKTYINGFTDAKNLRMALMNANSAKELITLLN